MVHLCAGASQMESTSTPTHTAQHSAHQVVAHHASDDRRAVQPRAHGDDESHRAHSSRLEGSQQQEGHASCHHGAQQQARRREQPLALRKPVVQPALGVLLILCVPLLGASGNGALASGPHPSALAPGACAAAGQGPCSPGHSLSPARSGSSTAAGARSTCWCSAPRGGRAPQPTRPLRLPRWPAGSAASGAAPAPSQRARTSLS